MRKDCGVESFNMFNADVSQPLRTLLQNTDFHGVQTVGVISIVSV